AESWWDSVQRCLRHSQQHATAASPAPDETREHLVTKETGAFGAHELVLRSKLIRRPGIRSSSAHLGDKINGSGPVVWREGNWPRRQFRQPGMVGVELWTCCPIDPPGGDRAPRA